MPHRMKANDRKPAIQTVLGFEGGGAANLTGATVSFIMGRQGQTGPPKVNAPALVVNAAGGVVRYDWKPGDTDTPGVYEAEWEVIGPDGLPQTFPTAGYDEVIVFADKDSAP